MSDDERTCDGCGVIVATPAELEFELERGRGRRFCADCRRDVVRSGKTVVYRSPRNLAIVVAVALALLVLADVGSILLEARSIQLVEALQPGDKSSRAHLEESGSRQETMTWIVVGIHLATAVAFLAWF